MVTLLPTFFLRTINVTDRSSIKLTGSDRKRASGPRTPQLAPVSN